MPETDMHVTPSGALQPYLSVASSPESVEAQPESAVAASARMEPNRLFIA